MFEARCDWLKKADCECDNVRGRKRGLTPISSGRSLPPRGTREVRWLGRIEAIFGRDQQVAKSTLLGVVSKIKGDEPRFIYAHCQQVDGELVR